MPHSLWCLFSGVPDRMNESTLQHTFEAAILTTAHPRTLITVSIQEMQDSGGVSINGDDYHALVCLCVLFEISNLLLFLLFQLLACAINAGCLAIMNSGLPMRYLVAAVNCMVQENGEIILDPDEKQLKVHCFFYSQKCNSSFSCTFF